MEKILKSYLKRLTNLTGNNRSLLLLRPSAENDLDLHSFDYVNHKPSFQLVEDLIGNKNKIFLCDKADARDDDVNVLSKRIKRLQRKDQFIETERGARDLYVSWPFVHGKFMDGTPVRCPLLFIPVTIGQENDKWYLYPRKEESITFNKSFLLAYAHFNEIKLDDELIETTLDDFEKDSRLFRTSLYRFLQESPLELNFNQDMFADQLRDFHPYKKETFEESFGTGQLKVFPEAVLGIFPQAGSYLVPDYHKLLEENKYPDLETFFYERTSQTESNESHSRDYFYYLNKVREEHMFTPFRLDASQENAIKAIKNGDSMVVQGPPGTGKSQLICNLISDQIAKGKRVLVVCQKRAALDVVYQRMKEMEMAEFLALVHDFKNDRRALYQQINQQIERLEEYRQKNNSLDSIYLERQFVQDSRQIDQITEELDEFREALFQEGESGRSPKELYLTSDPHGPQVDIKQEFKYFPIDEADRFETSLKHYFEYANKYDHPDFPWLDRKSFASLGITDLASIKETLDDLPAFLKQLSGKVKGILNKDLSFGEMEWFLEQQDAIEGWLKIVDEPEVYQTLQHMPPYQVDEKWFLKQEKILQDSLRGGEVERTLPKERLGEVQAILDRALKKRKRLHQWVVWVLFSKEKFVLRRVLVANGLSINKKDLNQLSRMLDNRMNVEHVLTSFRQTEWLRNVPEATDTDNLDHWLYVQYAAIQGKKHLKELRSFSSYIPLEKTSLEKLKEKVKSLFECLEKLPSKKHAWSKYLSAHQIARLAENPEEAETLKQSLDQHFDALCEYDRLYDSFQSHERAVVDKLSEAVEDRNPETITELFRNSIRLAWIEYAENKYPVLRNVSSLRINQLEDQLQSMLAEKFSLSKDILLMKARERIYRDVEYNRLRNMVTYRELNRQVTKKKKIWPIRQVVAEFADELFELIPCWLASPETVSAVFPMEQFFDLVIFDEASQCFSERGVPAMYRGKQVMVTGDDKQLSPNDLYQVRWEEDDEEVENPELEIDSLLDLSARYLQNVQLKGHYRSRSLELIDFSNQHFYNGNLTLLPHFKDANKEEPSIEYRKLDGIWEKGTNPAEAHEIIQLVRNLLEQGIRNIGIVAFNFKQQHFILDLLEESAGEHGFEIPDELFVKNIENVQGDERDIIIFSIGYAPDASGRMVMQFGSLNIEKGENRLNVAVTRARRKVYVISSIYPEQLQVEETKNEGPRLLKKYLQYALNVSRGEYKPALPEGEQYQANWFLSRRLPDLPEENYSFKLIKELPFADLTIKDQRDKYKGLILTDDVLYHQSPAVKDPHAYTPMLLQEKDWHYRRFFSRELWANRDQVKDALHKYLYNLSGK